VNLGAADTNVTFVVYDGACGTGLVKFSRFFILPGVANTKDAYDDHGLNLVLNNTSNGQWCLKFLSGNGGVGESMGATFVEEN
jgi:hypothetical protein